MISPRVATANIQKYFSFSSALRILDVNMLPKHTRDYQGAIETLNTLQTNAQYLKNAITKPKAATNLPEVTKFLKRSGLSLEDLNTLSVIHITGTNGKGTTCAYSENILRKHGYKTGFYSSPHLLDVRERIRINGKPISKTEFSEHFWRIFDLLDAQKESSGDMPLYFRYLTVMAFHVFLTHKVDVAILEVGIGGEYDCTNIVRNTKVAGITPLDLDHTSLLGNSLELIAWNKSGIFKENCAAISVKQPESVLQVFQERSIERNCSLTVIDKDLYDLVTDSRIPLHIQKTNASLALAVTQAFIEKDTNNNVTFSLNLAKQCIEETCWPGRYEIKQFQNIKFFLDGAHTLGSICICRNWFTSRILNENKKKVLIFNLTGDRDANIFFKELSTCEFNTVIFTPNVGSDNDRPGDNNTTVKNYKNLLKSPFSTSDSIDYVLSEEKQLIRCEEYKSKWLSLENNKSSRVVVFSSFSRALEFLNDGLEYNVLITGSIHLVGAALSVIDPNLDGSLVD